LGAHGDIADGSRHDASSEAVDNFFIQVDETVDCLERFQVNVPGYKENFSNQSKFPVY